MGERGPWSGQLLQKHPFPSTTMFNKLPPARGPWKVWNQNPPGFFQELQWQLQEEESPAWRTFPQSETQTHKVIHTHACFVV